MKKIIISAVLMLMLMLPAGCVSGSREQMVSGIRNQLAKPEVPEPEPDYSGLSDSWDETGRKAGDLWDDLTELAAKAGSDMGTGLKKAAQGAGEGLGVAAGRLGEAFGSDMEGLGRELNGGKPEKDGQQPAGGDEGTEDGLEGPFHILRVVDGDTVKLKETGSGVRYRLIGIDTPESVADEEYLEEAGKRNTGEGKAAGAFLRELLPKDSEVWIAYDAGREDKYGRQLIYLYTGKDGETVFINELLLREGYARMVTVQPNVRYADTVFTEAQRYARENGKGFWGTGFFEE